MYFPMSLWAWLRSAFAEKETHNVVDGVQLSGLQPAEVNSTRRLIPEVQPLREAALCSRDRAMQGFWLQRLARKGYALKPVKLLIRRRFC